MAKKEDAERLKVAKELCQEDGYDWDSLDDYGKHSYEHYAAVVIRKRPPALVVTPKEIQESPSNKCPACNGKGFTEEQGGLVQIQCGECGGTGEAQVKDEPQPAPTVKGKPEVIPDNQYWCDKCRTLHRITSKIGKRHSGVN